MKLAKLSYLALTLVVTTAFFACKKDKKDDAPATNFTFKENGNVVNGNAAKGVLQNQLGIAMLSVTASVQGNTAAWGVTVHFPDGKPVAGTFSGDAVSISYSGGVGSNAYSSAFEGGSATINLTKVDDHNAIGTFSGTVVNLNNNADKKVISEGKFSVKY